MIEFDISSIKREDLKEKVFLIIKLGLNSQGFLKQKGLQNLTLINVS